ncbi:hypothetical protein, partial [Escherichia coli]|uniref:hypothetical protein n=1 Tax=Escherichia coli TaxID=562 RepID=UPI002037430A
YKNKYIKTRFKNLTACLLKTQSAKKNTKKNNTLKNQFAAFCKNNVQPCGNPVFMRVQRGSPF